MPALGRRVRYIDNFAYHALQSLYFHAIAVIKYISADDAQIKSP